MKINLLDNFLSKLFIILVFIISALGLREILIDGFWESHDGIIHVIRLAHFYEALNEGQFPVRWLETWMAGYGSPIFIFNWSLPYYVSSFFHWLGFSYQASIELIFIIGYLLSGMFSFLFLKDLLENNWAALVGTILYQWAPYRFTDIFIRGTLGEATAFLFLPLLFWILIRSVKSRTPLPLWTSFIWMFFILTHNVVSLISMGVFSLYLAYLWSIKLVQPIILKSAVFVSILGIGLAAFFWLPAVVEKKLDEISNLKRIYNYTDQFPSLEALANSQWKYAYATPTNQKYSMSFQLGKIHWVIPLLLIIVLVTSIKIKSLTAKRQQSLFFIIIFILSIFMSIKASKIIYDYTFITSFINFPWRFLGITTFTVSVLSAILITTIKQFQIILALIIILGSIYFYFPYSKIVSWKFSATDNEYLSMIKTNTNFLPDTEFLPKGARYLQLLEERGPAYLHSFFEDKTSRSTITNIQSRNLSYTARISNFQPVEIKANTFYFPGWKLYVDNQESVIGKDQYGLIKFNVNPGIHEIRLVFKNTPIRTLANAISVATLMLLVFLLIRENKNRFKSGFVSKFSKIHLK